MLFKTKLRALGWFTILNAIAAIVIASRFFEFLPNITGDKLGLSFVLLGTFSHLSMLAGLFAVLLIPVLILPKLGHRLILSAVATFALAFLFIDTLVFAQYRFHINTLVLELIFSGQVVDFPLSMWIVTIASLLILWTIEWFGLVFLQNLAAKKTSKVTKYYASLVFFAFISSSVIHIWAAAHVYQPVVTVKRYLPVFRPISSNTFMAKLGWINREEVERQKALSLKEPKDINYPVKPLTFNPVDKPINIVMLVIDSWRYDSFNEQVTPNLWRFAKDGVHFNNHLSSSNSTRTGIFGLFYGLPGTYWNAFLANHASPVLMNRLQDLDYQIGVFASAHLRVPEFNQTVFARIPDLREESEGDSPYKRDLNATHDWLSWYAQTDKNKPKFSFVFYDGAHGYDFPANYPHRFEPMLSEINYLKLNKDSDPTPFFNRYKTSLHFLDSHIKNILDALSAADDLENTLVIITGDHSQEMNDNKQNYWGHNGNFTNAQVHVPFTLVGPNLNKELLQPRTTMISSHYDFSPSLLQHYLGLTSDTHSFSTGINLFGDEPSHQWVLAGNYDDYALIGQEQILHINVSGQHQLLDKMNNPIAGKIEPAVLQDMLEKLSRFNK